MKNHTDAGKQEAPLKPANESSRNQQKLARALKRNLLRRKAAVRTAETGAES